MHVDLDFANKRGCLDIMHFRPPTHQVFYQTPISIVNISVMDNDWMMLHGVHHCSLIVGL